MIVSHRHRFIFLKTKKTGSTSVEIALSKHCGDEDIITQISPEDERLRGELGYRSAQNFEVPWGYYRPGDLKRLLKRRTWLRYRNHSRADWLQRHLPPFVWRNYFKFCVERNPWDRALSSYYWRNREASELPPFDDWLRSASPSRLSNFRIYSLGGRLAVDRVIRYERLAEELNEVAEELQLPEKLQLPQAKGQYRTDRRSYREVFDSAQRDLIALICAREIELLGYEF